MKKIFTLFAVIGSLIAAGQASALDTAQVDVSANVVGTCKFNSGGAVIFGALDPANPVDVNGTVTQPQAWCTKGATYTISDDDGVNESGTTQRMKHDTLAEYIEYSFTYTASGSGAGPGTPFDMDIASTVVAAQYQNASAGNYTDIVTLTITP